jgi:hypothetical protein
VERWAVKTGIDPDAQLVNQKVVVPTNIIRLRSSISPPPMSTTTSAMTVPRVTIALAIYQAALLEADEALAPDHEVVQHCDVEHQHDRGGVRDVACMRCGGRPCILTQSSRARIICSAPVAGRVDPL